jgi:hypothetical protein
VVSQEALVDEGSSKKLRAAPEPPAGGDHPGATLAWPPRVEPSSDTKPCTEAELKYAVRCEIAKRRPALRPALEELLERADLGGVLRKMLPNSDAAVAEGIAYLLEVYQTRGKPEVRRGDLVTHPGRSESVNPQAEAVLHNDLDSLMGGCLGLDYFAAIDVLGGRLYLVSMTRLIFGLYPGPGIVGRTGLPAEYAIATQLAPAQEEAVRPPMLARRSSLWLLRNVTAWSILGLVVSACLAVMTLEQQPPGMTLPSALLSFKPPRIVGQLDDGGMYVVSATVGAPRREDPSTVWMGEVQGKWTTADREPVEALAWGGSLDTKVSRLELVNGVTMRLGTGILLSLQSAAVRLQDALISSREPVRVRLANGPSLESDGGDVTVNLNTKVMEFRKARITAVYDDLGWQAESLEEHYEADQKEANGRSTPTTAPASEPSVLTTIMAKVGVVMTWHNKVITGDVAEFDVRRRLVVVTGKVVSLDGEQRAGQRLIVDLSSGSARWDAATGP